MGHLSSGFTARSDVMFALSINLVRLKKAT